MSEHEEIEAAVRAYFSAPPEEVDRLASGPVAEFLRLTKDVEDPSNVIAEPTVGSVEVVRVEGDEAEATLQGGTDQLIVDVRGQGPQAFRRELHGPVRLRRSEGVWKVEDYTANGRLRSASLRLRPAGFQQVDELRVSTVAVDLRRDGTFVFLRLDNRRTSAAEIEWAALGVRRLTGWSFVPLELLVAAVGPATSMLMTGGAWKVLPLDVHEIRLILVEKGKPVGFDFVVTLDPKPEELDVVQRPPESLPLRLRLHRSPLALAPLVLVLLIVFWLGSWPSLGAVLAAFGALMLLSLAWHRLRGRRFQARRPLTFGSGVLLSGLVVLLFAGLPFAGCPSMTEAREPADRFALALLTEGPEAAAAEMWEPIPEYLPRIGRLSASRAKRIVQTGRIETGSSCVLFPVPALPGLGEPESCVIYELPSDVSAAPRRLSVFVGCHSGSWHVVGIG